MKEKEFPVRKICRIILHCSATRENLPFSLEQLRQTHLEQGLGKIGYHFYVTRDGGVHSCLPLSEAGVHTKGFNRNSIGICYEGGLDSKGNPADTRTQWQKSSLFDLVFALKQTFPEAEVAGHSQLNGKMGRKCPCFDVKKEWNL